MAHSVPGPTITLGTLTASTAVITVSAAPVGVTVDYHQIAYGRVNLASSMVLSAQVATGASVTLSSLTTDVYYLAMGFTTDLAGDLHGPGNVLAFSVPYNAFPNMAANNTAISRLVSGLSGKVTTTDFVHYTHLLANRIHEVEETNVTLQQEIKDLLQQISSIRNDI